MTLPRSVLVDPDSPGIYHCVSRCVRRAFLCGGPSEHRKGWITQRLRELDAIFAIDACAYAVLDNHLHVIVRTAPDAARQWSPGEVIRRWLRLYPKRRKQLLMQSASRWSGLPHPEVESRMIEALSADAQLVERWRTRLASLSWYMKCLKEPIAHRANREDGCKGHFWEGRFRSLRILDLQGLLASMIYVDLNVIHAGLAQTPEASDHTSVQERIRHRQRVETVRLSGNRSRRNANERTWLVPIAQDADAARPGLLPMTLDEYLTIVDATGRQSRARSRGIIPRGAPPILERLRIDACRWLETLCRPALLLGTAVGGAAARASEAVRRGTRSVVSAIDIDALA